MVQALALTVYGPGIGVFGSGRDGGREATFDGPMPTNTHGHQWNGYGVIQAKYKERLEDAKRNSTWLLREIRKEFKQWDESTDRRKPEYYVLATNVILSSVNETGGIDSVNDELSKRVPKWNLRGFDVWHYDKIVTLLDNNPAVAENYSAWITPSQLLANLKTKLHDHFGSEDTFDALARSYPARELIAQRYVNLDQAGRADDKRIRLAQVFVDVPSGREMHADSGVELPGVAQTIIELCNHKTADPGSHRETSSKTGRVVIVGGPGQGKSTISQFICQVYRRELLASGPMSPEVLDEVNFVEKQLQKEKITPPAVRRWPIQIPLNRLADELARDKATGILDYIAQRVTKQTEIEIRPEHCREWLRRYPWLVALDGLDEVPASGNRQQLMDAIERFLSDVHTLCADVVIVATTRPQGYREEFSPQHYRHINLAPLPVKTGLRYGEELIRLRTGEDLERIDQLVSRLRNASGINATARLMETPLQVTILTVLISRMGEIPRHRYDLFNDYYGTIYNRELEKGGDTARLLRDYQSSINTLHNRVGLLLQKLGEEQGESSALLPVLELRQIVERELQEEELCGDDLELLTERIIEAATDRLVFLVAPRESMIGFEIRSLQEYCAARGITDCTDEEVIQRIESLAPSSHWRNVVLFVCGWIFFHRKHLRDSTLVICDNLDSAGDDELGCGPQTLPGSRLAMALASDVGASITMPKYQRLLGGRAARVLRLLPCKIQRDLASLPSQTLKYVKPIAEEVLQSPDTLAKAGVLRFAAALALRGDRSLLDRAWRAVAADEPLGGDIAVRLGLNDSDPFLLNIAEDHILQMKPKDFHYLARGSTIEGSRLWQEDEVSELLEPALRPILLFEEEFQRWREKGLEIRHRDVSILFSIPTIDETAKNPMWAYAIENRDAFEGTAWQWLVDVAEFCLLPSEQTLMKSLNSLENSFDKPRSVATALPWPIGVALTKYSTPKAATEAATAPEFGTIDLWRSTEREWQDSALAEVFPKYPTEIAWVGFTMDASGRNKQEDTFTTRDLIDFWRRLPAGKNKINLARAILICIAAEQRGGDFDPTQLARDDFRDVVHSATESDNIPVNWLYSIEDIDSWIELICQAGEETRLYSVFGELRGVSDERRGRTLRALATLWRTNESRIGIARVISALLPSRGLSSRLSPPLDIPTDFESATSAELGLKLRQFEGWDASAMAELICTDVAKLQWSTALTSAHPEFPELDKALIAILRNKSWHLAAELQESMASTQEATPVDSAHFIPKIQLPPQ